MPNSCQIRWKTHEIVQRYSKLDIVSCIEVIFDDWTVYEHVDYKGKSLNLKV